MLNAFSRVSVRISEGLSFRHVRSCVLAWERGRARVEPSSLYSSDRDDGPALLPGVLIKNSDPAAFREADRG